MVVERIGADIETALADPSISAETRLRLRQMKRIVDINRRASERARRAALNRERQAAEVRATSERVGVPFGRFLAATGVTTTTPILDLVPPYVSEKGGFRLFLHLRTHGGGLMGLDLGSSDTEIGIKSLKVLGRAVLNQSPRVERPSLTETSVMGDVLHAGEDVFQREGFGPIVKGVLLTMVEQLPPPPAAEDPGLPPRGQ